MYFILKPYNRYSVGFDIDPDAIKIAQENSDQFEVCIDFVNTDLLHAKLERFQGKLDTIIMNPPFGTKNNKGIDMLMLKKAIDVSFGLSIGSLKLMIKLDCQSFSVFFTQVFH